MIIYRRNIKINIVKIFKFMFSINYNEQKLEIIINIDILINDN